MGDGVNGPEVIGVALDRLAPQALGLGQLAAFLQAEGEHSLHMTETGHGFVPGRIDLGHAIAQ